jgi:DNA-binding MarR family transcriptional regulator
MTADAASNATGRRTLFEPPCKPRANCLKPKEIWKTPNGRPRRFDLRDAPNYLKVKTIGRHPTRGLKLPARRDHMTILDSETKAVELPEHHADELRLWLRLLTCTTLIEGEVRSRLRERFDVTLPRFDLMAQLDKVPEGMTLSEVSKRMMVSNGNVTGLVERLVISGHLDRRTSDSDRRVQVIRLTKAGRAEFRKMAAEHESWIADIFSDLTPKDVRELMRLLSKTKGSAQKSASRRAT